MSYLKKLYERGEERINSFKQKYGNPLQEFEDALADLHADMNELMKQAAEFNAVRIRAEQDIADYKKRADEFAKKAEDILKAENTNPEASEKAAAHALSMKHVYAEKAKEHEAMIPEIDEKLIFLKEHIEILQERIERYEKEYQFLKSKYQRQERKKIHDYFYKSDIENRFEQMKEKLEKNEFDENRIEKLADDMYLADKILNENKIQDELENLKSKLNKK